MPTFAAADRVIRAANDGFLAALHGFTRADDHNPQLCQMSVFSLVVSTDR